MTEPSKSPQKKPEPFVVSPSSSVFSFGIALSLVLLLVGFLVSKSVSPAYEIESNAFDSNTVETMNWPLFSLWIVGAAVAFAVSYSASAICRALGK